MSQSQYRFTKRFTFVILFDILYITANDLTKDFIVKPLLLISLLTLAFCTQSCAPKKQDDHIYGGLVIEGSDFKVTAAPLFENVVEASMVNYNNSVNFLTDVGMNGNLSLNGSTLGQGYRFAYVMKNNGVFYNFYQNGGNIAMKSSTDLINWSVSQTVLTATPGNFAGMWNPGVTVDDNNVWHILVECNGNSDNAQAGLCYSHTTMVNGVLNFDANKQAQMATELAGNAWMQNVPGKGIVAIYGKQVAGLWEIRAGILVNGVMKESQNFKISAPGIHICDPHAIETTAGVTLVLSYDQFSVYELQSQLTMSQLFDQINQ